MHQVWVIDARHGAGLISACSHHIIKHKKTYTKMLRSQSFVQKMMAMPSGCNWHFFLSVRVRCEHKQLSIC